MLGYCLEIVAYKKYAYWYVRTQGTMCLQEHKTQELKMTLKIGWFALLPGKRVWRVVTQACVGLTGKGHYGVCNSRPHSSRVLAKTTTTKMEGISLPLLSS